MKEKLYINIIRNFAIFFSYIFLTEIIIRILMNNDFIKWETLRISISSIILALIISVLISAGNKLWQSINAGILATFIAVYGWLQINMYLSIGAFMGLGMTEQGGKVLDYFGDTIKAAQTITFVIFVPYFLIMFYYCYLERKIRIRRLNKTNFSKLIVESKLQKLLAQLVVLLVLILLSLSYYLTLNASFMQNPLQQTKNMTLFRYPSNASLAVSQFGVLTYLLTDSTVQLFGIDEPEIKIDDEYIGTVAPIPHEPDYSREIDDRIWQEIINTEKDNTINSINRYLINRPITPKNEMTGIFKDKNLIIILLESVNDILINEELYPTFYKLYTEGISFRNNYSPRNNCATGNNEFTSMTSLYSINTICSANEYNQNRYFQSVFNVFNEMNYTTSSYHNHGDIYYSRAVIHRNMGSGKYMGPDALGISWTTDFGQWASDKTLMEKAVPNFIGQAPFMAYITTVTPHRAYTVSSVYGDMYTDMFNDTNYSRPVKRYLSKLKELDLALESLLNQLEEAGELENTVIALFADHYPHGLSNAQVNEVLSYDANVRNEMDRTPMVIYNAGTEPKQVYKYTTLIDLLPTLLNMFDADYDPRYYFGNDVFSNQTGRAVFADGTWQDEIGYFSASSGKFTPTNDNDLTYSTEEIVAINANITQMQKMSTLIIRNNYFNVLNRAITRVSPQFEEQEKENIFESWC